MSYTKKDIADKLHASNVNVTFTKVNGEMRVMKCTLQENVVPAFESKGVKKENDNVLSVWDLDKSAWRSFRVDSVKSVEFA